MTSTMNRREFVKTVSAGTAAASMLGAATPKQKPNILFVMTDQEPTTCIHAYGNKLIKTPARDAIANSGIIFKTHFTASYACSPSRATMITGRYTHNHGVYQLRHRLDRQVPPRRRDLHSAR